MTKRVAEIAESIKDVLALWRGVDSVTCIESGADDYDPYFFASLDVYVSGRVPSPESRRKALRTVVAFESSTVTRKDRFLVDGVPFRIEYKDRKRFDELVEAASGGKPLFRDSGTYAFYRLAQARLIYSRTEWIPTIRERLTSLPDGFWDGLREAQRSRAEHTYADLAAAVARNDQLYFLVSSSRFVGCLTAWAFARNHEFQPSDRLILDELARLPVLPSSFLTRLSNFVRQDGSLSLEQRRELAGLLVHSVVVLDNA